MPKKDFRSGAQLYIVSSSFDSISGAASLYSWNEDLDSFKSKTDRKITI